MNSGPFKDRTDLRWQRLSDQFKKIELELKSVSRVFPNKNYYDMDKTIVVGKESIAEVRGIADVIQNLRTNNLPNHTLEPIFNESNNGSLKLYEFTNEMMMVLQSLEAQNKFNPDVILFLEMLLAEVVLHGVSLVTNGLSSAWYLTSWYAGAWLAVQEGLPKSPAIASYFKMLELLLHANTNNLDMSLKSQKIKQILISRNPSIFLNSEEKIWHELEGFFNFIYRPENKIIFEHEGKIFVPLYIQDVIYQYLTNILYLPKESSFNPQDRKTNIYRTMVLFSRFWTNKLTQISVSLLRSSENQDLPIVDDLIVDDLFFNTLQNAPPNLNTSKERLHKFLLQFNFQKIHIYYVGMKNHALPTSFNPYFRAEEELSKNAFDSLTESSLIEDFELFLTGTKALLDLPEIKAQLGRVHPETLEFMATSTLFSIEELRQNSALPDYLIKLLREMSLTSNYFYELFEYLSVSDDKSYADLPKNQNIVFLKMNAKYIYSLLKALENSVKVD